MDDERCHANQCGPHAASTYHTLMSQIRWTLSLPIKLGPTQGSNLIGLSPVLINSSTQTSARIYCVSPTL